MEVGAENQKLKVGDRVVVPFTICCGECGQCSKETGQSASGQTVTRTMRPKHSVIPRQVLLAIRISPALMDEPALFLGDIFPTGWMAADNCEIEPADIVAIWGCGPVGQFCIKSAIMLGAARVIAIDNVPERLALARLKPSISTKRMNQYSTISKK
jgi:threonine dehydrogenase-like Zn-dependent dehydrogenase